MSALATRDALDVERAAELLEKCRDVDVAKEVRDKAAAIEHYQRERKGGSASRRAAAEIVTRAELRLGELLAGAPKSRGGRPPKTGSESEPVVSLRSQGIDKKDAMRWQRAAKLPEEVRERFLSMSRERGEAPTTNVLAELAKLPPEAAAALVERVSGGEFKGDMRAALAAYAHEQRHAKLAGIAAKTAELDPAKLGQFPILLADPPWQYEGSTTTPSRQVENHYPTMPIEEIRALRVRELATDDAVLFLWATSPLLPEALSVLEPWGFTYKTSIVWDKQSPGMGYWARIEHELLLIATRGNPPTPKPENRPRSIVRAPLLSHSEKPRAFHELIERMFPDLRKLELFARAPREGWLSHGNQLPQAS